MVQTWRRVAAGGGTKVQLAECVAGGGGAAHDLDVLMGTYTGLVGFSKCSYWGEFIIMRLVHTCGDVLWDQGGGA